MVMGLGGMKKDCPECKGSGFSKTEKPVVDTKIVVKRKYVRAPKIVDEIIENVEE